MQVEAFKHGFAVRTALGDPGTPQQPFKAAKAIHAAVQDLLDDSFVTHMRRITSDDTVLRDTVYGGRWGEFVCGTYYQVAGGAGCGVLCHAVLHPANSLDP